MQRAIINDICVEQKESIHYHAGSKAGQQVCFALCVVVNVPLTWDTLNCINSKS